MACQVLFFLLPDSRPWNRCTLVFLGQNLFPTVSVHGSQPWFREPPVPSATWLRQTEGRGGAQASRGGSAQRKETRGGSQKGSPCHWKNWCFSHCAKLNWMDLYRFCFVPMGTMCLKINYNCWDVIEKCGQTASFGNHNSGSGLSCPSQAEADKQRKLEMKVAKEAQNTWQTGCYSNRIIFMEQIWNKFFFLNE